MYESVFRVLFGSEIPMQGNNYLALVIGPLWFYQVVLRRFRVTLWRKLLAPLVP